MTSWFDAYRNRLTGSWISLNPGDPKMFSNDIIVPAGLAGVFCWIYIILPLVFYHG